METLTLTTPISSPSVVVARLILDWAGAAIYVVLVAPNGHRLEYSYAGATATNLMIGLNKANLSVKSLHKRIIEQLVADHPELAGVISGAPD
jgi:hypothetical protein